MDQAQLDPFAEIMIQAYLNTAIYRRQLMDEWEQPPTTAAKVHHLRSVAQVLLNRSERFELSDFYLDHGHLGFADLETGARHVVRSDGAVSIERQKQQRETLFERRRVPD